jgi:hypothetical protein
MTRIVFGIDRCVKDRGMLVSAVVLHSGALEGMPGRPPVSVAASGLTLCQGLELKGRLERIGS